jgi:hypothetical protein
MANGVDQANVQAISSAIAALREQLTIANERAEQRAEADRARVDVLQAALADAVAAERIAAGMAAGLRAEVDRWRHMGWLHRIFSRVT